MKTENTKGSGFKSYAIAGGIVLAIVAVLGGTKAMQIKAMMDSGKGRTMPAETVCTAEVRSEEWRGELLAVGSVSPVMGVALSFEASGVLAKVEFENGAQVKAGQMLASLNTDVEMAQLVQAEAQARLNKISYERSQLLRHQKTIAQSDLDSAEADLKKSEGRVAELRGMIERRTIRAPFDGRAGIRQANVGQLVNAGTALVSIQSIESVYVDFTLPQQTLPSLRKGSVIRASNDTYPDEVFAGQVNAVDTQVTNSTRNVKVQAVLPNPKGLLQPGMFVRVSLELDKVAQVLTVPLTAVIYAPYGNSVFVVEDKKDDKGVVAGLAARQQFVRLGETRGDFVAVIDGLTVGQKVVSSGAFKLRNGSSVVVDNAQAPDAKLAPAPPNS